MALKKSVKRISSAILAAICVLFVSCGPNLGNIEDEEDYGKKFPGVKFVKSDLDVSETTIGALYNDSAVNNFNDKDFVCSTESNAYKYMAVFTGEDLSVKEFAIYLRSDADVALDICVYNADDIPSVIATGSDVDFETYTDAEDSSSAGEKRELKEFDEPTRENAVAEVSVSLKAGKWGSFSVRTWEIDNERKSSIFLKNGSCLLFQFRNNCVVYDDEEKIVRNDNPPVKICFTAMLICVG